MAGEFATAGERVAVSAAHLDRKSTRLNSSHVKISYAVFCLKKKNHTGDTEGGTSAGLYTHAKTEPRCDTRPHRFSLRTSRASRQSCRGQFFFFFFLKDRPPPGISPLPHHVPFPI